MLHKSYFLFKEELQVRRSNKYIILHHTKDAMPHTADDVHKVHQRKGMAGIGYHYFIDKKGEIYEGRPVNTVGAHARGFNAESIGIGFEGDYNKETLGERPLNAAAMLIALLKFYYFWENIEVKTWNDLNKETDDPGKNFPFERLKRKVEECLNCLNAFFGEQWGKNKDNFYIPDGVYGKVLEILAGDYGVDDYGDPDRECVERD